MNEPETFRVGLVTKQVGWLCIGFFSGIATWSYVRGESGATTSIFLGFVFLGVICVLLYGSYEINNRAILQRTVYGTFRINWDEVTEVEIGFESCMVLHGPNKRFAMVAPGYWTGKEARKAYEFIQTEINTRKITQSQNARAAYKSHWNVRIRESDELSERGDR